jgi:uncharacterized membrane protein YbaN (DUF454 family)
MIWLGIAIGIALTIFAEALFLIVYMWPCWKEASR